MIKSLSLLLVTGATVVAQTPDKSQKDVEEELLALLNTPITVAGKKAQKISEAPAIISVITAEDLRNQGVTSVAEALSLLPGINLTETFFGYTSVSFRGNLQTHYNNKWLFMLNDHPMFEPVTGDSSFNGVPLSQIKRIEVLRGPGSAIYGTNAFTGVVKVITFNGEEGPAASASAMAGSFGARGGEGRYAANSGKFHLSVGASAQKSDGYPYTVKRDENGRSGEIPYKNDLYTGSLSLGYGDWTFNAGDFSNKKSKFGLIPTLVTTGDRTMDGYYLDSGYTWRVSEKWDVNAYGYYDSLKKEDLMGWYPPAWAQQQAGVGGPEYARSEGTKYGFILHSSCQVSQDWRLTGGLFGEFQKTGPYDWRKPDGTFSAFKTSAWLVDYDSNTKGGYFQADARLGHAFAAVAGVRYTHSSVYGDSVSPSAGLVFNATPKLSFKALYGTGTRDPNFFELHVATANVVNGNTDLKPEKVKSYELGMDYLTGSSSLRLNAFWANTNDLISRSLLAPVGVNGNTRPTPQYGNIQGQKLSGIEGEIKGSIFTSERHFLNVSLLQGTEKKDSSDVLFIPKVLGNFGVNLLLGKSFTLSPYVQYVGAKEGTLLLANGTPGAPVRVGGYSLTNLNLEYRFSAFWLSITGKNLFDKVYASPEYIRRLVPETPGGPGRSVYFQIGYRG